MYLQLHLHLLSLDKLIYPFNQGHSMDLFLKISVLQANFCWLGDLDKITCPWKLENCGCLR